MIVVDLLYRGWSSWGLCSRASLVNLVDKFAYLDRQEIRFSKHAGALVALGVFRSHHQGIQSYLQFAHAKLELTDVHSSEALQTAHP